MVFYPVNAFDSQIQFRVINAGAGAVDAHGMESDTFCDANGVPIRVFKPESQTLKPGVIYSHGGGWVLGGPETHGDEV